MGRRVFHQETAGQALGIVPAVVEVSDEHPDLLPCDGESDLQQTRCSPGQSMLE